MGVRVEEHKHDIIGQVKTKTDTVFISNADYKGVKYLDIRKHYSVNDEWRPTKTGITFKTAEEFDELLKILNTNKEKIKKYLQIT
jgi:hypothetical protein